MELTGRIYDVRELDSIAIILVDEPSKRGLYRLGFADGSAYVGQSVNVISRFTSHRKRWEDIVTFEFFPVPAGDLNIPERTLIAATESAASVRNVRDTNRPYGEDDVEFTSTEGISTFLPWERGKRVLLQSWAESSEDSVSHSLMVAACGRSQAVSKTRLTITASGFGCP